MYARGHNIRGFSTSGLNEQRIRLRSCRNTLLVHRVNSLLARFSSEHITVSVSLLLYNLLVTYSNLRFVVSVKIFLKSVFVVKQFCFLAAPDLLMKDAIVE